MTDWEDDVFAPACSTATILFALAVTLLALAVVMLFP